MSARVGEAYVAIESKLYRSTGGLFTEVPTFGSPTIRDVHVTPSGRVYTVSTGRTLTHCRMNCEDGTNHSIRTIAPTDETLRDLCGSGERVFALGFRTMSVGVLYEFDDAQGTWIKVSNNLGTSMTPSRCEVGPTGEVYIVGGDSVVRYEQGAVTDEPVDLRGQALAVWESLALSVVDGGIVEGMLVGQGGGYRFARRNLATRSWTALPLTSTGGISAVVAISPREFLAAGYGGSGSNRFMWWDGSTWAPPAVPPPNTFSIIHAVAAASEREVFLVGAGNSSYAVVRGRR